ncbi:tRNA pseudouridine(13) synthase TruD [Neptunicella marina]|uniref:tRNA pseudouridine synthase D n=1 Tax=Neptunicella marina TaxID=2125989 RepID=A0A8J6M2I0_9ALTE|nr:tRNA pseudouridine(13) synthase TruD [Neptunicella marina]MBC3766313.1 tRNA pseudouridine(13) synthase TruD [Neptunicella marina]
MQAFTTNHWCYLRGHPPHCSAVLKSTPSDFQVTEIPSYELSGEGEHIYLWLEKENLNTAFVAEQLARFCKLPLRAVTYAGRKDKFALTYQYFGIHSPGNKQYEWQKFSLEGVKILSARRHNKKLRTGSLKGNRFTITLRNISAPEELESALKYVKQHGVPNYFGEQRFGNNNSNLSLAQKMIEGETIRNRNKRSMCISAMRSWLFNEFVSQRIAKELYNSPVEGDLMILSGNNSFFKYKHEDVTIKNRLLCNDIQISAPMWGTGTLASAGEIYELESNLARQFQSVSSQLEALGLKQERRAIHLQPQNMSWSINNEQAKIEFELSSGCYATSVLRECVITTPISTQSRNEHNENTAE